GVRWMRLIEQGILDNTYRDRFRFLEVIQRFVGMKVDVDRSFIIPHASFQNLIDFHVKIVWLIDRRFIDRQTCFDVITEAVVLPDGLSMSLVDQVGRPIRRQDDQWDVLIISFYYSRSIMKKGSPGCTVEIDRPSNFHGNSQCYKTCGSFIRYRI